MDNPLIKEFVFDASADQVWRALTDVDQLKKWYFPQIQKFEPVLNFKFEFDQENAEFQKEWIVTSVEKNRIFAHSWAYKGFAGKSEVTFEIIPHNFQTKLRVTQTNLSSFPKDVHFRRERFDSGWDNLLGKNLKSLLLTS